MTNHKFWKAVLAEFELKITKPTFNTWLRNTGLLRYENGEVAICIPSLFHKGYIEKKYHQDIIKSIERITGKPMKKIEYIVENVKNISEQECIIPTVAPITMLGNNFGNQPNASYTRQAVAQQFGLNPKYTFATFVVGKGNELAHAAAQAVSNRPGEAYNPLFIYGGEGLGKTHLLQAIGHSMLEANPAIKILYVSSEKFTNEFVAGIKEGRAREFKDRYRNVDLLLIDDIQFIGGKEQTQEEFFHTFNELHQQGKQVVLSSDRPPKAIPSLEDRLRSRFEWGMIVDIAAPDMETRVAILQSKAQEKNFRVAPEIFQLIATSVQSNIRELEGALNKIAVFHQLKSTEPTMESVRAILASFESQSMRKSITPREIVNVVAKFFDISVEEVLGKNREKKVSFPRQIIMFLLRSQLQISYPAI